jgi:diacylglycerol kinase family enzyme
VRSLGLPGDAIRASQHLLGDAVRPIDIGKVTFTADGKEVTRYFANIAEAGLGAATVARTARLPRSLGGAKYFVGFWLTLPGFHPAAVQLETDDGSFEWRAHNVVIANCRFFGGGMHISPQSQPDDGLLDVLAMVGPKTDAFTMLPKIYKGTHVPHRNVAEARTRTVRIDANPPLLVEADGEILGTTPARFAVVPHPIRVKV